MKIDYARGVLAVALESGPWPRSELIALIAAAAECDERTVRTAARDLGVVTVRRSFWISHTWEKGKEFPSYLEGFSRQRLIDHVVCRQELRAATSDRCQREAHLDEIRDLMGATEVYVPYE